MFIDRIQLTIQAGNGGKGCESYHRRTDRKVVAHGGDGGDGGAVIVRTDVNAPSLDSMRLKRKLIAEPGGSGSSTRKRGRNGENLILLVPPGTRLTDIDTGLVVRDLTHAGEEFTLLPGGRGGVGNYGGREAAPGEAGAVLNLELSILVIADVFIVGLPNSGKSKFLKTVTRARVRDEAYAFSTKDPEIGVWEISDYETIKICELPSIYDGSHDGRGLGNGFLKHLERARLIIYMLEPSSDFAANLKDGLKILREQVKKFNPDFLEIPFVVVVTKTDDPEMAKKAKKEKFNPGTEVFFISSLQIETIEGLRKYLKDKLIG